MKSVEERLFEIEERNQRVELDKAWETSWFRRILIAVTTYVVVAAFLMRIHPENALIDAVIPCCGYLLSTLSLPPIKKAWINWRTGGAQSDNEDGDLNDDDNDL